MGLNEDFFRIFLLEWKFVYKYSAAVSYGIGVDSCWR